jgi:hypothetical protein
MGAFGANRTTPARAEWQDGNAISQAGNPSFGLCADIARVCANLLPRRLRARGQSVRDHRSAVDQMHSYRLRRKFSKALRRVLWPYARAPKKRGARPPATHSACLRGPSSAALAKQCLERCANYASDTTHLVCTGSYPNTVWHISFGDISGDTGDSARVDLCGPRLRASVSSRLRQPPTR